MTTGVLLAGLSPKGAFLISAVLTVACVLGAAFFAFADPIPSMVSGFEGMTLLLALTSAYAAWSWRWSETRAAGPRR